MNKPDSPIAEIKSKLPILDLVQSYVPLTKAGKNYKGLCPFHSEKTPSFMVSPDLGMFKCFGCFPKGSLVKTVKGLHPIETIQEGDMVVSGKGKDRKVLHTHKRLYKGNLVNVLTRKLTIPVTLTEDHQVYTLGQGYTRRYEYLSKRLKGYYKLPELEKEKKVKRYFPIKKTSAGNLQESDALLYPINSDVKDIEFLDLNRYYNKVLPKHGTKPKKLNLVVPVERDFLELVGWYLAEGSSHRAYLRFSFGSQEKKKAYEVYGCIKRLFGLKASLHYRSVGHSGIELTACHSQLANIFENLFGKGAANKHLPFEFQYLPPEKQKILLRAYWRGDGTEKKRDDRCRHTLYSIGTVSQILQEQIRDILLRLGFFPSVWVSYEHTDKKRVHHKLAYTVSWSESPKSQMYNLTYLDEDGTKYWVLPVKSAVSKLYEGVVYNLNVAEDNSYVANTFVVANCGIGGDIFEFVQQIEGVDFGDALKILGSKAGVEVKTFKSEAENSEQSRRQRLLEVNHLAAEFFHYILTKHPLGSKALSYLHDRGLNDQTIKDFKLGYAPNSWDSLLKILQKRDQSISDLLTVGVVIQGESGRVHDRFRGRVMVPFYNLSGDVVGFAGRTIIGDQAKYINSPESPLFIKSNFLYGLNASRLEIKKADQAIIVEGQMDFLAPYQSGFKNIVASGGTSLTLGQLHLLGRYTKNLAFCFDGDAAGDMAMRRAINLAEQQGFNVKLVVLPAEFKDPDECVRKDKEAFEKAIREALNVYDYYLESVTRRFDLSQALGKKAASNFLLPLIAEIPNTIEQAHYIQKAATLFGVTEEIVTKALAKTAHLSEKELSSPETSVVPGTFGKEDFVLSMLLKAPISEILTVIDDLDKKCFSGLNQGRFEYLKERILLDPELDVSLLIADSPEKDYWQNLYLLDTGEYKLEILIELVDYLKKESLMREFTQVSTKLRLAEAALDAATISQLQVEFNQIRDKLRGLKGANI